MSVDAQKQSGTSLDGNKKRFILSEPKVEGNYWVRLILSKIIYKILIILLGTKDKEIEECCLKMPATEGSFVPFLFLETACLVLYFVSVNWCLFQSVQCDRKITQGMHLIVWVNCASGNISWYWITPQWKQERQILFWKHPLQWRASLSESKTNTICHQQQRPHRAV